MSDLDKQELEATRKLNGVDTQVLISTKDIDKKIKELEEEAKCYDPIYCNGIIDCLRAVKRGDINSL